MNVGTIKEIKNHEYRVGMTPDNVRAFVQRGHKVFVETKAGEGAGFTDEMYQEAGATILATAKEVCDNSTMIIKVKEPLESEYSLFREDHILYTYLHLAADEKLTKHLINVGMTAIAYETITDREGLLPCLRPMSMIAGRLSVQEGAKYLEKAFGGRGILLGGVPGVPRAKVVIIGGGIAGTYAAKVAVGMNAEVTLLDVNMSRLAYLDDMFGHNLTTLYSTDANILNSIKDADLVIGSVLLPGAKAPKLIKREYLKQMKPGSVIVDIAIDQGGCAETSTVTTHADPIYNVDGVVHYCVGNMPGCVPYTSTMALTNATMPYALKIADLGLDAVLKADSGFAKGVNIARHYCTNKAVADSLNLEYKELFEVL